MPRVEYTIVKLRHNRYLSFSERLIGPFPEKLDKVVDNSPFSDNDPAFDAFARGKLNKAFRNCWREVLSRLRIPMRPA